MNIGEASKASGVSAKMIRYYEATGLVRAVARSGAGYRLYDEGDVRTLSFIRRARDLGFSVEQIDGLLHLWRDEGRASADVKRLALEHVAQLDAKAEEIQSMSRTLRSLAKSCHGNERPQCPIIDDIAKGSLVRERASSSRSSASPRRDDRAKPKTNAPERAVSGSAPKMGRRRSGAAD